jgi:hypothetical protein
MKLQLFFSCRSDEETSGDEAEDHETDEDKPLEANKAAQIQKLYVKRLSFFFNI